MASSKNEMGTPKVRSATTLDSDAAAPQHADETSDALDLIIAWSAHEPGRVGEIAVLPEPTSTELVLGRGADGASEPRLRFFRQRPGELDECPPLESPRLSRRQLLVRPLQNGARIRRVGRCVLEVNGSRCDEATIVPGDVVYLRRELVLLCARRAALIPRSSPPIAAVTRAFGAADSLGLIGESPRMWRLRERAAFAALSPNHVLIVGESGTGKELVARAVHALSSPETRPFVTRNAATLPPALIDAELFGNAKNYPNSGMPERRGLIGEADGGSLFLDEIGELPREQQAHLLRVLDAGGEYQRLGEAKVRRSRFRLVAATNRNPHVLKHDFVARFNVRIDVPGLSERREDIPLIARHLLETAADASPTLAKRFLQLKPGLAAARFDPELVVHLLRRDYRTHIRELEAVLWKSLGETTGTDLVLPADLRSPPSPASEATVRTRAEGDEPSLDEIRIALDTNDQNVPRAARALGLSSRFVLNRLMKKHGLRTAE